MRHILLDCDDVLLNWLGGFGSYMEDVLQRDICDRGPNDWNMANWLGIDDHEVFPHIEDFNASPAFGRLDPIDGAVDAMKLLAMDDELHVITSCSSDAETHAMRLYNLERHFGEDTFASLTCLDLGMSKKSKLALYGDNAVWVEDNYKNAMLGVDLGHRTYMRRTSHNGQFEPKSDPRITWFTDWSELNLEKL